MMSPIMCLTRLGSYSPPSGTPESSSPARIAGSTLTAPHCSRAAAADPIMPVATRVGCAVVIRHRVCVRAIRSVGKPHPATSLAIGRLVRLRLQRIGGAGRTAGNVCRKMGNHPNTETRKRNQHGSSPGVTLLVRSFPTVRGLAHEERVREYGRSD